MASTLHDGAEASLLHDGGLVVVCDRIRCDSLVRLECFKSVNGSPFTARLARAAMASILTATVAFLVSFINFGIAPALAICLLFSELTPKFANAFADWRWVDSCELSNKKTSISIAPF